MSQDEFRLHQFVADKLDAARNEKVSAVKQTARARAAGKVSALEAVLKKMREAWGIS